MFGLAPSMSFMLFIFWPFSLVAAVLWGALSFKNEQRRKLK